MGKQARLKQARREGKVVKKEPVYNMTQAQLDAYVRSEIVKFKKNIANEMTQGVIELYLMQCFDVLHTHFGFGELRLKRFRYYLDSLSDVITDSKEENPDYDYITDIFHQFEDKGFDMSKLISGKITDHELRRRCDMEKLMPRVGS